MNSYSYFPIGYETYGNQIMIQNTWGMLKNPHPKDNVINSDIVSIYSARRDTDQYPTPARFSIDLEKSYRNVLQIEMIDSSVPINNAMAAKGSFFIFLMVNGRNLDNVQVPNNNQSDSFDLNGSFAHVIIKGDPVQINSLRSYPRIFRFQDPPETLNRIDVDLRVFPTDPVNDNSDPMTFDQDEEVILTFEIMAQNK